VGYTYTQTDGRDLCEVSREDGLRCHDIHTKFHKGSFSHSEIDEEEFTDTETAYDIAMPSVCL
jgi:hypothetical protein